MDAATHSDFDVRAAGLFFWSASSTGELVPLKELGHMGGEVGSDLRAIFLRAKPLRIGAATGGRK
jgi:hypothetical protein